MEKSYTTRVPFYKLDFLSFASGELSWLPAILLLHKYFDKLEMEDLWKDMYIFKHSTHSRDRR